MPKEYRTIQEVAGPLMLVRGVEGVTHALSTNAAQRSAPNLVNLQRLVSEQRECIIAKIRSGSEIPACPRACHHNSPDSIHSPCHHSLGDSHRLV